MRTACRSFPYISSVATASQYLGPHAELQTPFDQPTDGRLHGLDHPACQQTHAQYLSCVYQTQRGLEAARQSQTVVPVLTL